LLSLSDTRTALPAEGTKQSVSSDLKRQFELAPDGFTRSDPMADSVICDATTIVGLSSQIRNSSRDCGALA
jgi:hypothetical protein